jgi:branched-chain amino acid transport system permease protein
MLELVVTGLAMGCIYALLALGFVLILNASGAINFAQGEMVMLGGFVVVWLVADLALPWYAVVLLASAAMVGLGVALERFAFRPLKGKPFVTVFISTIGVGIVLRNVALLVWGPTPRSLPALFQPDVIRWGGVVLSTQHLFIVGVTLALLLALQAFFVGTRTGVFMRAAAQDEEAARLLGVRTGRTMVLTFALSSLLAGLAGFLLAPVFFVYPDIGHLLILKLFIAVVIGGFGSVPGAILGGLFLGLIEVLAAAYVSSLYKDVIAFAVLMLFLFVKPDGLMGEAISEKV